MRRLVSFSIAAVLVPFLLLFGLVAGAAERFTDKENGWSFEPPANWRVEKADNPPALSWYGPQKKGYVLNLRVRLVRLKAESLDALIADTRAQYRKDKSVIKILKETRRTVSGSAEWTIALQRKMPNGMIIEQRQFLAVKSGKGFLLTGSLPAATAKEDGPIFDKVQGSFRWDK
jgi:hypothetical protein